MKTFKLFVNKAKSLDKQIKPTLITQIPCHGAHSKLNRFKGNTSIKSIKITYNNKNITEEVNDKWAEENDNIHLGHGTEYVHKKINKHDPKFKNGRYSQHVYEYTRGSTHINKHLINKSQNNLSDYDNNEYMKKTVNGIDKYLNKSKLDHDVHVYHGLKHWHPGDEAAKGGGHIKLPAYTSTSIDKQKSIKFGSANSDDKNHHILHIHLQKGDKASYLGTNSSFEDEKEMLLPRNTVLKVHPHFTECLHDGKTHKIWHCTVHSQD